MRKTPDQILAEVDAFLSDPSTGTIRQRPRRPAADDILDTDAVGKHLGLDRDTITRYLFESRAPGRRYSDHPFPEPAGKIGRRPYWTRDQLKLIDTWAATRMGAGHGGGRRPKDHQY